MSDVELHTIGDVVALLEARPVMPSSYQKPMLKILRAAMAALDRRNPRCRECYKHSLRMCTRHGNHGACEFYEPRSVLKGGDRMACKGGKKSGKGGKCGK